MDELKYIVIRARWRDAVMALPRPEGDALAIAIMDYAFAGDYDSSIPIVAAIMEQIKSEICQYRLWIQQCRANGKKGGRQAKINYKQIADYYVFNPKASKKDIAKMCKVSERTIDRAVQMVYAQYDEMRENYDALPIGQKRTCQLLHEQLHQRFPYSKKYMNPPFPAGELAKIDG